MKKVTPVFNLYVVEFKAKVKMNLSPFHDGILSIGAHATPIQRLKDTERCAHGRSDKNVRFLLDHHAFGFRPLLWDIKIPWPTLIVGRC